VNLVGHSSSAKNFRGQSPRITFAETTAKTIRDKLLEGIASGPQVLADDSTDDSTGDAFYLE
jgi:hypothetical protein